MAKVYRVEEVCRAIGRLVADRAIEYTEAVEFKFTRKEYEYLIGCIKRSIFLRMLKIEPSEYKRG